MLPFLPRGDWIGLKRLEPILLTFKCDCNFGILFDEVFLLVIGVDVVTVNFLKKVGLLVCFVLSTHWLD